MVVGVSAPTAMPPPSLLQGPHSAPSKDRSHSVPGTPAPAVQPRQPLLPFGGGHFGPLNGLRQLVSPRSSKEEEAFSIPLEEVLEELEEAGVASEEGFSIQRVLQVGGAGYRWAGLDIGGCGCTRRLGHPLV